MTRHAKIERKTEYKPVLTEIKAVGDQAQGILEGYLNVKNVEDLGGDISRDGCFTKTLADSYSRKRSKNLQGLWPFLYNHAYESIPPGVVVDAAEDNKGLWIRAKLFMDTERGRDLYSAYAQGGLNAFSMGYKAHQISWEKIDGRQIRNLIEVQIMEASSVVFPMAPESVVTAIKSREGYNSMLMRSKDFSTNYQAASLDDWLYNDFSVLINALRASIQELFSSGSDPMTALETMFPVLESAIRDYVQEGVELGYTGDSSNGMDMGMMSLSGAGLQSKAGYLNASDHAAIKESSTMIMKHAKIIANASANVERANARARAGALAGWPVYGSMSDRSIFEDVEDKEKERVLLSSLATQLSVENDMREIKEMLTSDDMSTSVSAGVDRALANLNASIERKRR